jgi:hypothetical protein
MWAGSAPMLRLPRTRATMSSMKWAAAAISGISRCGMSSPAFARAVSTSVLVMPGAFKMRSPRALANRMGAGTPPFDRPIYSGPNRRAAEPGNDSALSASATLRWRATLRRLIRVAPTACGCESCSRSADESGGTPMAQERPVAIVTGAASGIGRAMALAFSRAGSMPPRSTRNRPGSTTSRRRRSAKGSAYCKDYR